MHALCADGIPPQLSLLTNLRILSFDGCVRHQHQEGSWAGKATVAGGCRVHVVGVLLQYNA